MHMGLIRSKIFVFNAFIGIGVFILAISYLHGCYIGTILGKYDTT